MADKPERDITESRARFFIAGTSLISAEVGLRLFDTFRIDSGMGAIRSIPRRRDAVLERARESLSQP